MLRSIGLVKVFLLLLLCCSWYYVRQLKKLGRQLTTRIGQSSQIEGEGPPNTYRPKGFSKRTKRRGKDRNGDLLLKKDDFIFSEGWDTSPIVVESHKLVLFSVPKAGCTVLKQLCRRMMGLEDWAEQSGSDDYRQIPHNPKHNGLRYLHEYNLQEANEIISSSEYTRAIFVRDPKERFLSAFLDKALSNDGIHVQSKCCPKGDCLKEAQTFPGFVKLVLNGCKNPHWDAQSRRMEPKYWKYIDFVGHVENAASDAKELLKAIGAWKEFGKSGWGPEGKNAIFETSEDALTHATWAKWRMWQWYTPELETIVENFYAADYANPALNFTLTKLY